jgi:hypothetical protein
MLLLYSTMHYPFKEHMLYNTEEKYINTHVVFSIRIQMYLYVYQSPDMLIFRYHNILSS